MLTDWTNVAIVCFLFAGLIMSVSSALYAAAAFHAPVLPIERRRRDVMVVLEEMGRKTAAVEELLQQLAVMRVTAQMVLDEDDLNPSRDRDGIDGPPAGLRERRTVLAGPGKRR
ncbi:MAG: hypothetical protein HY208_06365 [Nitrospirae bacterium]|nr:hypothetical protein [Nitrospirota bacterium]